MGIGEQTDGRVRKTLVRSLVVPQVSRKVDSLVLPLELLRHLKPADISDAGEHRAWQLRQLRILEAGLVSHPSVPLDRGGNAGALASGLRETVRSFVLQTRPGGGLDVHTLSAAVTALCSRSVDACRWADGYPLNVHLYVTLLCAVFDGRDETVVLNEVDELMELIKKTWDILGRSTALQLQAARGCGRGREDGGGARARARTGRRRRRAGGARWQAFLSLNRVLGWSCS